MLMVVAMMLSVCMIEVFATSGTLGGYSISATVGKGSINSRFIVHTQSDVNMGVDVKAGTIYYYAEYPDGVYATRYTGASGSYYGYDLSIPIALLSNQSIGSNFEAYAASVPVQFGYNGSAKTINAGM